MSADRLSHPPLAPVAGYRSAEHLTYRQSHARSAGHLAFQEKHCHAGRKVPPPLLVDTLKVGMLQKPPRLGKCSGSLVLRTAVHNGFSGKRLYSRKPGFTETRLRPLARRRDNTACPLLVFIRERKPCFL